MNMTIRGNNVKVAAAMAIIAVLFVMAVAFAVQQIATTSEPDVRATSAEGDGGSGIASDPYVSRHAEVVAAFSGGNLDISSTTNDPYIDRHAEIVARYQR